MGPKFTWWNNRDEGELIRCKLDQVFSNLDWSVIFNRAMVFNDVIAASDHAMQRIELIHHKRMFWKRRWHFESAWINDSRCERIVSTEMERCDGNIGNFLHQLSSTKQKLGHQNPNPIKEIQVQIQKKKKELQATHEVDGRFIRAKLIQRELHEMLKIEELMWKQRS